MATLYKYFLQNIIQIKWLTCNRSPATMLYICFVPSLYYANMINLFITVKSFIYNNIISKKVRGLWQYRYNDKEMDIIFTVVIRLEINKLKQEVLGIDRKAFMVMHVIADTKGGMVKPRPLH